MKVLNIKISNNISKVLILQQKINLKIILFLDARVCVCVCVCVCV